MIVITLVDIHFAQKPTKSIAFVDDIPLYAIGVCVEAQSVLTIVKRGSYKKECSWLILNLHYF